jgi:SAM-dependent methyltransferase
VTPRGNADHTVVVAPADEQRQHWSATFAAHPDMYGDEPSDAAVAAAGELAAADVETVLELGAGQGRDTLYLAHRGFHVHALDYAFEGIEVIEAKADTEGLGDRVTVGLHDVRQLLPFADATFDASYSHMLLCMALTTPELERLVGDVRRVLRPGGHVVYTVRTTDDAHYGTGIERGDDMYEHGGFVVHFFDHTLIERLADGFVLVDVSDFTEGELPRRLARVTMRRA